MEKRTQFNARVRPALKDAAVKVAQEAGFTNEELVEVALAALLGTSDELILAKRNKAQRIAAQLNLLRDLTFRPGQLSLTGFGFAA